MSSLLGAEELIRLGQGHRLGSLPRLRRRVKLKHGTHVSDEMTHPMQASLAKVTVLQQYAEVRHQRQ